MEPKPSLKFRWQPLPRHKLLLGSPGWVLCFQYIILTVLKPINNILLEDIVEGLSYLCDIYVRAMHCVWVRGPIN